MKKIINIIIYSFIISVTILFIFDYGLPYTKYLLYTGMVYLFILEPLIRWRVKK